MARHMYHILALLPPSPACPSSIPSPPSSSSTASDETRPLHSGAPASPCVLCPDKSTRSRISNLRSRGNHVDRHKLPKNDRALHVHAFSLRRVCQGQSCRAQRPPNHVRRRRQPIVTQGTPRPQSHRCQHPARSGIAPAGSPGCRERSRSAARQPHDGSQGLP
ncbi:hypothetical protein BKA80DRAFT_35928 [Phyllosticta citrichinensis]